MKCWNFNEHVKTPQLTKFWASTFKNGKVTGLKNTYYDAIEALNVKIYNFLKNLHQNTPAYQIFTFCLENYQSYKAFHVSHYNVIMTSYKPWIKNK